MLLSPYSALGPMVLVSLKDKECPLFQLGLIFFTILLLHLRTKSVVKPVSFTWQEQTFSDFAGLADLRGM